MTAREFVDWTNGLINSKDQKLVGDINHGYSYMDTDKAIEMQKRIDEQLKRENAAVVSAYCKNDVRSTEEAFRRMTNSFYGLTRAERTMEIKNVIFNDPATIVIWKDGSKTVVKCGDGDVFDPEKGLAMAIAKRVYGNKGRYYETFKKWLPEEENTVPEYIKKIEEAGRNIQMGFRDAIGLQEEKHITLKEYCLKYNITKNVAYGMIKRGDLHAYKDEKGKWIIPIN